MFDQECLGMGESGFGYAAWEKSCDGAYAPCFVSGEAVWSYQNVTFVALDCFASEGCGDGDQLQNWVRDGVIHSFEIYNYTCRGGPALVRSSHQEKPWSQPFFANEALHYDDRVSPSVYTSSLDEIMRNQPIMDAIPGCVKSEQPKCCRTQEFWRDVEHEVFGGDHTKTRSFFDFGCFDITAASISVWPRKGGVFALSIAAKNALMKMGLSESSAMIAVLKCRGQI